MCVCVRERERLCVCVCERERERERLCVCERERERERECVCVCVCACLCMNAQGGFSDWCIIIMSMLKGRIHWRFYKEEGRKGGISNTTLSPPKLCCVKMGSVVNNFNISLLVRGNVAKSP